MLLHTKYFEEGGASPHIYKKYAEFYQINYCDDESIERKQMNWWNLTNLAWREMNCLDLSADLDLCFLGLGMESREALLSWEPTDPRLWSVEESAGEHIGNGEYTGVRI